MKNPNLDRWVIGILLGVIFTLGGYLYNDLRQGQVRYWDQVTSRLDRIEGRVNVNESRLKGLESLTDVVTNRLNRIEDKLDILLRKQ